MRKFFTDPATRSRPERFHDAQPLSAAVAPEKLRSGVPEEFCLGKLRIALYTVLAPMAGVSDTVFRRFIKYSSFDHSLSDVSHCGLIMTEFTSADGIYRCREAKRKRYLHFYEDEHPISAQLFGSDIEVLGEAAKIVEQCGFDAIDLNLGCPAKKVVKCNGGSRFLRDLPPIPKIFWRVGPRVALPLTVKIRIGWGDTGVVFVG